MPNIEKADKSGWLEQFASERSDLFYPETWTEEQRNKANDIVKPSRMKTAMFSSIPMNCQGTKCPIAHSCPLLAENLAPVGKPCPIESATVREFMMAYMEELNVNPESMVEVSMVRDMVDLEIQKIRTQHKLAKEDFVQEDVIGINENTGEPIYKKAMNLAVDLQDRLHKRNRDLRKEFMATREQRAKVGMGQLDSAQTISKLMLGLRQHDLEVEKLTKRKLGLEYQDDYIEEAEIIELPPEDN